MRNNAEIEREINLKDLLYKTLKKWRSIVNGAVIIALLAALLQVVSGVTLILDKEKYEEAKEKYKIMLEDHEATGERLRTSIVNLRDQSAKQREYNEKSELMKIDPMNKWVGNLQIYIDSKYQIDPTMTYQNVDLTNRLVSAYASYLHSGDLYNEILAELDTVDEIRYLREIYSVASDPGTATITVSCYGKNEAEVRTILDFVKLKITERFETIQSAIGDHSVDILTESVYSTIDPELDEKQKANLISIMEYANSIAEKNEALIAWEGTKVPKPEYGAWYTAKRTIKFLIVGGIAGAVVVFCWLAASYALSDTVKTEDDWKPYGIPVLGQIKRDEKKKHLQIIDKLIDRAFGHVYNTTMEQGCALTAAHLAALLRVQGESCAKFVGHIERDFAENLTQTMATAAQGTGFSFVGDPLTEPDTASMLGKSERVILLAENLKTKVQETDQMITLFDAWGVPVTGVVLID